MKKLCGFQLVFIFTVLSLSAQENYTSISLGPSFPLGTYSKIGNFSSNGFALGGGSIRFDGAYYPNGYLGYGATFSFGSNYIQKDTLAYAITSYLNSIATAEEQLINPETRVSGMNLWSYVNLMSGLDLSFRPGQNLYVDLRLLGGFSFFSAPAIEINIQDQTHQISSSISSSKISLGYTTGIAVRREFSNGLIIRLAADYYATTTKVTYEFSVLDESGREIEAVTNKLNVDIIETSIGIAYSF